MKVPKYIINALYSRQKAADKFLYEDRIISEFIHRYNINCEYCDMHVETLCGGSDVISETISAIQESD